MTFCKYDRKDLYLLFQRIDFWVNFVIIHIVFIKKFIMENKYIEISFIKKKYPLLFKIFSVIPGFFAISLIVLIVTSFCLFFLNRDENLNNIIFFTAIVILWFYLWWLIRWFEFIIFTFMASFKIINYKKLNFDKILKNSWGLKNEEILFRNKLKKDILPEEIIHRFIIPTYKESFEIIKETCENLLNSNYDKRKFAITLAWEERDEQNFLVIAKKIIEKYKDKFFYINYTVHPKWIEWEIPGKWANISFSSKKEYENILNAFGVAPDKVVVTTLDADTNIDSDYPNILTYNYIVADNRKYKSYQPMIFFFNNFWDAPFFSKIISLGNSFWMLFNSLKKFGMRNFSTHAQSLDALIETDFWSKETIVEDGHQYRRSYFVFGSKYECLPIFTKVYQDCNLNTNIFFTAKAQYNQIRRWAHGAEDLAYVLCQWVYNKSKVSFGRTFYEFMRLFEWTILWSTLHIVLMFWFTFTLIKDIPLSSFMGLGGAISFFVKISFLIFIFVIWLQMIFTPWNKLKSTSEKIKRTWIFLWLYLFLIGPTLFIFSWMPALHSQIAIMIWKPMKKFNITKKVRK